MTAMVLPEIDRSTVEELRKKLPSLSEIELPSLPSIQDVGKTADQTIDRLLGRSKAPVWPWIVAGIGLVAVLGAVAVWFAWLRRPTWDAPRDTWSGESGSPDAASSTTASDENADKAGTGLTAAEASLTSNPYPIEEA